MFSLLTSSVCTPRYAPPLKKKVKFFSGSCRSRITTSSSSTRLRKARTSGADDSWAYTSPPAITLIDTTNREMIKVNFLRDIVNPPERFYWFHAGGSARFPKIVRSSGSDGVVQPGWAAASPLEPDGTHTSRWATLNDFGGLQVGP